MKQYAIVGISSFGKRILEELIDLDCEIILIDKDPELIDFFKNDVTAAYVADVINEETVRKLIPPDIDAAIVDLGDSNEASILTTLYLKKLDIKRIIVRAETSQHGEILKGIGAHHVVFPNLEAAKRVTPLLVSDILFNYLLISDGLVLAETGVPPDLVNKTLIETNLRHSTGINVIAVHRGSNNRSEDDEPLTIPVPVNFEPPDPNYRFTQTDKLLVIGEEEKILVFTNRDSGENKMSFPNFFRKFFRY